MKKAGNTEEIIKLEVSILKQETFDGSSEIQKTLGSALKARAAGLNAPLVEEFKFAEKVKKAITKMHSIFKEVDLDKLSIPNGIESTLEAFGIRKETLRSNSSEDVITKLNTIIQHDPLVFFKLLVS